MGNLVQSSTPLQLQKRYKVVKQSHQDLTLLQELQTGNEYCLKCFMFNSNEGLQACVEKLNVKKRINHQHILSIKQIYNRSQNTFCSNIYKVYAIIEYPFRTLSEEIIERKRNEDYFNETELWSIIYSCSMALNYLYSTNLTHGCLTSNKIYIQNDGLIKISDPNLFNENNNLINYMTNSNKQHVYISPEQITQINSNRNYNTNQNLGVESSDAFILGMIILEAIYLEGMEGVYDHGIHNKLLNQRISNVEGKYSKQLRAMIERMLVTKVDERITFEEIETIIENNNFDEEEGDVERESEESSRRGSLLSRRPLDSLPSSANVQSLRKEEGKPLKTPNQSFGGNQRELVQNQNVYNMYNVQNRFEEGDYQKVKQENQRYSYNQSYVVGPSVQVNQMNQIPTVSQIKKIDPLIIYSPVYPSPSNHSLPYTNYNIPPPAVYAPTIYNTPANYSPTSQYTSNSWNLNTSINNSLTNLQTNLPSSSISTSFTKIQNISKPIDLPNYDAYPTAKLSLPNTNYVSTPITPLTSQPKYSFQPHKIIEPVKVEYDTGFITPPPQTKMQTIPSQQTLPDYSKYQPLNFSKVSINNQNTSPVQRLKTIEQAQEIQREQQQEKRIIHQHPNSVIAEVTETEISGVDSPKKQQQIDTNSQPQYVNEDSESGSHYQGYKLNGKKHGFGRLYYQDGGYYQGEWKFNKMNGFAKLYYQSGDIAYEGYWVNDKLHGKGKVFNDNPVELDQEFDFRDFTGLDDFWQFYDGEFAMDAKQGFGTIKLTNGEIFEGEFDKDVIEGRGKFYALNGKIINGVWKENKLVEIN